MWPGYKAKYYGKPFVSKLSIQKMCRVTVSRIDSILFRIYSICTTFDSIVSTIDSVRKTDSMQNYRLDRVPRSAQFLLILPCSSQSFNNRVDSPTPTAAPWHLTTPTAVIQSASRPVFCFTPHLRQSPVALKAGRQTQENQTRSKTMKTTTGTRHALLTAPVTERAQWVWLSAKWLQLAWANQLDC